MCRPGRAPFVAGAHAAHRSAPGSGRSSATTSGQMSGGPPDRSGRPGDRRDRVARRLMVGRCRLATVSDAAGWTVVRSLRGCRAAGGLGVVARNQRSAALTPRTGDLRRPAAELRQNPPCAPAGRAFHRFCGVLRVVGCHAACHASSARTRRVANSCNSAADTRTRLVLEVSGCPLDLQPVGRHNKHMPEGKDADRDRAYSNTSA
jgi:hypothetical protein